MVRFQVCLEKEMCRMKKSSQGWEKNDIRALLATSDTQEAKADLGMEKRNMGRHTGIWTLCYRSWETSNGL